MRVELKLLQVHGDDRGGLISLEENINVPFTIRRVYYLMDTKPGVRRGMHAHRSLTQMVMCVRGRCHFILDDGTERIEIALQNPEQGLIVPPMVWREMYDFSEDCVLMVLADQLYDEKDYLRSYHEFLELAAATRISAAL